MCLCRNERKFIQETKEVFSFDKGAKVGFVFLKYGGFNNEEVIR